MSHFAPRLVPGRPFWPQNGPKRAQKWAHFEPKMDTSAAAQAPPDQARQGLAWPEQYPARSLDLTNLPCPGQGKMVSSYPPKTALAGLLWSIFGRFGSFLGTYLGLPKMAQTGQKSITVSRSRPILTPASQPSKWTIWTHFEGCPKKWPHFEPKNRHPEPKWSQNEPILSQNDPILNPFGPGYRFFAPKNGPILAKMTPFWAQKSTPRTKWPKMGPFDPKINTQRSKPPKGVKKGPLLGPFVPFSRRPAKVDEKTGLGDVVLR